MKRILILGLGNDILTDDAIGLRVVRRLQELVSGHPTIEIRECAEMGLALLDHLEGYAEAFIVDSILTGTRAPGFVHALEPEDLQRLPSGTPHFLGVGETLALGERLGLEMPTRVRIFAIEVSDPFTVGTRMSPSLEQALPGIVRQLSNLARSRAQVLAPAVTVRGAAPAGG